MMMTISLEVAALPTERRDHQDGAGDDPPQRKKRPSVEYLLVFEALRSEDWANYGDQIKELAEEATMIRGDYSPEAEQRRLELSEQHRNLLDMRSYMGSDMPIFKAITKVWKALVAGSSVVGCQGTPTGMCQVCGLFEHLGGRQPCRASEWPEGIEKLEDEDDFYLKCKDCQRPNSLMTDFDGSIYCEQCYYQKIEKSY